MPYLHRVGNLDQLSRVCGIAGYVGIAERRYREALAWLDEALDAARRLNDPSTLFVIPGNQGLARLFLHELEDAGQQFCDALAVCREAGHENDRDVDETLLGLAAVEASHRQDGRAARLTGAAKAHQARRGFVNEEIIWWRLIDDILAPARDRYGPERWDVAEREGAALTVQTRSIWRSNADDSLQRPTRLRQPRPADRLLRLDEGTMLQSHTSMGRSAAPWTSGAVAPPEVRELVRYSFSKKAAVCGACLVRPLATALDE